MKKFQILLMLIFFLILGTQKLGFFGQVSADPAKKLVQNKKQNGDEIYKQGEDFQNAGNYAEALISFENSLDIYKENHNQKGIGDALNKIGTMYYYQGKYLEAMNYFNQCAVVYQKINNIKGVSSAMNNIGAIHYYLGNHLKALEYYKKAVAIQEKLGDQKIIAATTQNIGGIYLNIKDFNNAMKYYKKANAIYQNLKDNKSLAQNLNGIGEIYMKQHFFKNAHDNFLKSLNIAKSLNDKQKITEVLFNLGELFRMQNNFEEAQNYYNQSLDTAIKINNLQYTSISQIAIGNIFLQKGKAKEAQIKCETALSMAEKLGAVSVKKDACDCLYKTYKLLGNDKKALDYYEKNQAFKDSLQSEQTSNKIMSMEFQQKQLLDSISFVKKEHLIETKHKEEVEKKERQKNYIILTLIFILIIAAGLLNRLSFMKKSREAIRVEKDNSERLLLNILPQEIADELKQKGYVDARNFSMVSILFTDFKSFTETSEKLSPQELVEEINICFKAFDNISEKYKIEKIKTIGDSYMAAGGIPQPHKDSLKNIVSAGIEMQEFMLKRKQENNDNKPVFEMRLGIHVGPIVAGIVGVKKFQYDVWGDTVNTASRMESNGMIGKVNISEFLYDHIKDEKDFSFHYRGNIQVKGKGEIKMYFVERNVETSASYAAVAFIGNEKI
ncbi:adenylate/guanylate cyclase domain-containing protein [Chryseobacterium sp. MMS23-Vi53]|uniref:adenylate/guanylate cyclase domain-containing protein n=1 Tax=Chryseobacterium sp. MMS23-Vi53 TaxID=3386644 RepID=UPI0039E8ED9E